MSRKLIPIEDTDKLCKYCNAQAKFVNVRKHRTSRNIIYCCNASITRCIANKEKNTLGLKKAYSTGKRLPTPIIRSNMSDEAKQRQNHNKGKRYAVFEYGGKGRHKSALLVERGHICESCKLETWLSKKITLEMEHVDGDKLNNRRDNLRLLCPNCHSQTPTWRKRKDKNTRFQKYTDQEIIDAIKSSSNLNQVLVKLDLRYGSAATIINIMGKYSITFMGH